MEFEYRFRTNKQIYSRWMEGDRFLAPRMTTHSRLLEAAEGLLAAYPEDATMEIHLGWESEGKHYDLQYRKKVS